MKGTKEELPTAGKERTSLQGTILFFNIQTKINRKDYILENILIMAFYMHKINYVGSKKAKNMLITLSIQGELWFCHSGKS